MCAFKFPIIVFQNISHSRKNSDRYNDVYNTDIGIHVK